MQIFLHFFGHLAQFCSVVWLKIVRSFGGTKKRDEHCCSPLGLEFAEFGFADLLDLVVRAPAVEDHADSIVLDRLTFTSTEFDEIGDSFEPHLFYFLDLSQEETCCVLIL